MDIDHDPAGHPTTRTLDDIWHDEHDHLHTIASRLLRDPAEADDVVQEAFGRLLRVDLDEIDNTRAWLTVAIHRLCLNRLNSAYNRRESTAGPTPLDDTPPGTIPSATSDPADQVTLDDQVRLSLAVVLDQLSPAERTSFVLHDIFGFRYDEIGKIVGRTATTCRQLASRGRRAVRSMPPLQRSSPAPDRAPATGEHRRLVECFIAACDTGDVAALVEVLDPHAASETLTLDGRRLPCDETGRHLVEHMMRILGPGSGTILVPVLGDNGVDIVAFYSDGRRGVFRLQITNGLIKRLDITVIGSVKPTV